MNTNGETIDSPVSATADSLVAEGRRMMRLFDPAGYEEAVSALRHALDLEPGSVVACALLAETYSYWGFREELNARDCQSFYDMAMELAERAVLLAPNSPEAHRALSVALRRGANSDIERSRSEILVALDLRDDDADTWYQYWRAFGYEVGDPSIHRALDLDPELCGAYNDMGAALCGQDRFDEALSYLQAALKLNPRNSLVQYNVAMVLDRMDRADKGLAVLNRARRMLPNDPLLERGWASLNGGQA